MIRRMIVMLVVLGVVLGGYFWFQQFKGKMIHQFLATLANPPQTISTVTAATQTWQPEVESVGSLRAVNGAALSLEVGGVVDQIGFHSGDDVQAGQVLLRLRADDDTAKLAALEASASLAQVNYDRDMRQFHAQAVSQAVVDTDNFNLKNARAQADEQKAELAKKTLRAPFAGHLGIRAVDLGQYLTPGTTVVTLEALDPLFVDFSVPQQALDRVALGQAVTAKVDTFPDQKFQGKIIAVSPSVDTDSRNVQMRASLPNPEHRLLPGMFATIDIAAGAPERRVTLPQTAITYNPYGSTVYLVEHAGDAGLPQTSDGAAQAAGAAPKLVARQVFVTTGETRGDQVAVLTGVKQGDVVVSAGQIKLHNGSTVLINNTVLPSDNPAPVPADH
jgi:membrane fusion protein, multidrug efflux system